MAVLTPLGRDFGAKVAPTWAPGPSLTLENNVFPKVFHTFQGSATFAIKSSKRSKNKCPDPSGGPVRSHFGCPDPSRARLCGPSGSNLGAWTLSDPSKTVVSLRCFHTFQEIVTFAMKSAKRPQNDCPDPCPRQLLTILTPFGCDFWAPGAPKGASEPQF